MQWWLKQESPALAVGSVKISPFDLFGYGRYQYTFQAVCAEEPECMLQDGATRIFLNTRGKNDEEVSEELVEFLHYLENTTDEAAENTGSERIKRIHNHVCKVKASEEVGVKYMQAWEEKYYEREEALEEGREEGRQEGEDYFAALTEKLIKDSRLDELSRAVKDKKLRDVLYREYGIKTQ